jgi:hypothetical protein
MQTAGDTVTNTLQLRLPTPRDHTQGTILDNQSLALQLLPDSVFSFASFIFVA